jgi:hypothetical protein
VEPYLTQTLTPADVQRMGDDDRAALVDWLERLGDQDVICTGYVGQALVIPTYAGPVTASSGTRGCDGKAFVLNRASAWLAWLVAGAEPQSCSQGMRS